MIPALYYLTLSCSQTSILSECTIYSSTRWWCDISLNSCHITYLLCISSLWSCATWFKVYSFICCYIIILLHQQCIFILSLFRFHFYLFFGHVQHDSKYNHVFAVISLYYYINNAYIIDRCLVFIFSSYRNMYSSTRRWSDISSCCCKIIYSGRISTMCNMIQSIGFITWYSYIIRSVVDLLPDHCLL